MSAPDRAGPPGYRREAARWLAIAEEDIDVALAAARIGRPGASAYHVQQAAEKIFKGLLVLAGQPFRRTHDLEEIAEQVLSAYPEFDHQIEAVRHLSDWGIAYRYPGLEDASEALPEIEELERVIAILKEFAERACRLIDAK
jgi:HEPN domain-containing protein